MAKGTIDKEQLRHIQKHAAESDEDKIRNAYQKMKYRRPTRVEGGNLVLSARLKKRMAEMKTQAWGFPPDTKLELSQEQLDALRSAFEGLDGHTLLALMTGQLDFYGIVREVLDKKLRESGTAPGENEEHPLADIMDGGDFDNNDER